MVERWRDLISGGLLDPPPPRRGGVGWEAAVSSDSRWSYCGKNRVVRSGDTLGLRLVPSKREGGHLKMPPAPSTLGVCIHTLAFTACIE